MEVAFVPKDSKHERLDRNRYPELKFVLSSSRLSDTSPPWLVGHSAIHS